MDKESKAYKSGQFDEFFREAENSSIMADEDVITYSQSYLKYEDTLAAIDYAAKENYDRGYKAGYIAGITEKLNEEINCGSENGIYGIIRTMIQNGLDSESISKYTGIPTQILDKIFNPRPEKQLKKDTSSEQYDKC